MSTHARTGRGGRAGGVAGRRVPAWEDPAGRALASLRAGGVPIAERRLLAGEPIYRQGDPDGGLRFVLSGAARVYKRYGQGGLKEATVALVGAGGVFGEPALEAARPHRDGAEAARGGCRVATVGKAALARHVARDASCGLALLLAYWGWAQSREAAITRLLPRGGAPPAVQPALGARRRAGVGGGPRRGAPHARAAGRDGGLLPGGGLP